MADKSLLKSLKMRPLRKGEGRSNMDGFTETEITRTIEMGSDFVLAPSLWSSNNKIVELKDKKKIVGAVADYEKRTGKKFPRFKSIKDAGAFAARRSKMGGVNVGPLAR